MLTVLAQKSPRWVRRLPTLSRSDVLAVVCGVFYCAAIYLLIQWVTISFLITGNGPIKWAEGYRQMVCDYSDCDEW